MRSSLLTLTLTLLALAHLCPEPANAATLISNLSNPTVSSQDAANGDGLGQAFIVNPGFNATITAVTIRMNPSTAQNLAASSLTLVNAVTGALLSNLTLSTAFAGNTFENYDYTVDTSVVLTENTVAAIQMAVTSGLIAWSQPANITNTSNGLTHAYHYVGEAPVGAPGRRPNRMLTYEIQGTLAPTSGDGSVPEPATLGLIGSALAGLAFLGRRGKG